MLPKYVLITPARNEEGYIEKPLQSLVAQTHLPRKWVIVSDGSTDRTDEIVRQYVSQYPFIELVRAEDKGKRNFGSKVAAFNVGYERLEGIDYSFIGNLDADVSFEADYFAQLLQRLTDLPNLGIAGGIILERVDGRFVGQWNASNSVAGAVQMFRRACYENVGGYLPLTSGGIDSAAEITARMNGWEVRTFAELEVLHHRRVSVGKASIWMTSFRKGTNDFVLGYHPLFEVARAAYRIAQKPYVLGSSLLLAGFCWEWARGSETKLPKDVVHFLRCEQLARLRTSARRLWPSQAHP